MTMPDPYAIEIDRSDLPTSCSTCGADVTYRERRNMTASIHPDHPEGHTLFVRTAITCPDGHRDDHEAVFHVCRRSQLPA
jgi:hypothetical protein